MWPTDVAAFDLWGTGSQCQLDGLPGYQNADARTSKQAIESS